MGLPSPEHRLDVLERQVRSLRRGQQQHSEWLDTICSPMWKRLWWFAQGYRFYRVGRWRSKPAAVPQADKVTQPASHSESVP